MAEYKKNHYIPRVILKNWVTTGPQYEGVHVFEIDANKFSFSASKGSSGFSFAIVNDLYVPILEGGRVVSAEKWLSGLEGTIGSVLPMVLAGGDIQYASPSTALKFVMGLLSLEFRAEYILDRFKETLEKDLDVRSFLGLHSDRTVHQIIVENIVNSVDEYARRLLPVRMTILQTNTSEFIVTDRPVVDEQYVGQRIIVVAPSIAIALEQGAPPFSYQYSPVKDDLVHSINIALATNARSWIAGTSEEIVKKYSAIVGSDVWTKSKSSEKVHTVPFKQLSQGWEFKKS